MTTLGDKLRSIRKQKGFPQKAIAQHIGIRRSNYSRVEHNLQRLTPEQIKLFCEFCDVSADFLLGIEVEDKVVLNKQTVAGIRRRLKEIEKLLDL
jgi:transcriptional regulator with XRE-family HTH domain